MKVVERMKMREEREKGGIRKKGLSSSGFEMKIRKKKKMGMMK